MFFQNVFSTEYSGSLTLGDRQYTTKFVCLPNNGRGNNYCHAFTKESYDLTGNDDDGNDRSVLTINYAFNFHPTAYSALNITVDAGAASASAVTAKEIVNNLNNNTTFAEYFLAEAINAVDGRDYPPYTVRIKTRSEHIHRFYISNKGAETRLKFNAKAGVSDMPTYFSRHTIENRFTFSDSAALLIPLNHLITGNTVANPTVITSPNHGLTSGQEIVISNSNSSPTIDGTRTVTVTGTNTFTVAVNVTTAGTRGMWSTKEEASIIANAVSYNGTNLGFDETNPKEDWELLSGTSGLFLFKKQTVDSNSRVLQSIEYHCGSVAGDLARKIQYTYTSSQTAPDNVTEIPYTLTSADLITPP